MNISYSTDCTVVTIFEKMIKLQTLRMKDIVGEEMSSCSLVPPDLVCSTCLRRRQQTEKSSVVALYQLELPRLKARHGE